MNKNERIHKLMELLQASLDGKEIEQVDCGHWFTVNVCAANLGNVHQFRVKPNVVTKKYRVALLQCEYSNKPFTNTLEVESYEAAWEGGDGFIRWLTPWVEYTVEEE